MGSSFTGAGPFALLDCADHRIVVVRAAEICIPAARLTDVAQLAGSGKNVTLLLRDIDGFHRGNNASL
jgi:hypothetical protein